MVPIGAIGLTSFGPILAPYITGMAVRALVHICFPIARNLCFIERSLKIREQMGIYTVETNGSVVRVMSSIMPTLSLRHIPSIGSVQRVVEIIFEVEDMENTLESIDWCIDQQHWRSPRTYMGCYDIGCWFLPPELWSKNAWLHRMMDRMCLSLQNSGFYAPLIQGCHVCPSARPLIWTEPLTLSSLYSKQNILFPCRYS